MNLTNWNHQETYAEAKNYTCGFCGFVVAARTGYGINQQSTRHGRPEMIAKQLIALCPKCSKPTFWDDDGKQIPGAAFGDNVTHLPSDIDGLYKEARNCMAISAFTAGAMACRKILMNVAVDKGATPNLKFVQYVEFLEKAGYVPPNGRDWVDHIRNKGNEAAHEIPGTTKSDLEDLLVFLGMLLKFAYEFPHRVPKTTTGS